MIKFGPSGNSVSFYDEGHISTTEAPKWVSEKGLSLFEYSFGKGVNLGDDTARMIGEECAKYNIDLSVHAPYYINFASDEAEKANNSINYLLQSLKKLKVLGGTRCVFHPGAQSKQIRTKAVDAIYTMLNKTVETIYENKLGDMIICPETMGKLGQIGTVDEIVEFCKIDKILYPCIDFGHVNAREGGSLKTRDDFKRIIDTLYNGLGDEKTNNMHIHFSKIEFTSKGEVRHLTFADSIYGPNFYPLAEVLNEYKMSPHILCESAGTQAEDALAMKEMFESLSKNI